MNFEQLKIKMQEKFPNHAESTINIRISCAKRVMKECYSVSNFDSLYYENIRDYKEYIYSIPNKAVRKNLCAGMYRGLDAVESDLTVCYRKFYQKMASEADSERIYRKPTTKELAQQKKWSDLVEIRKTLFLKRNESKNAYMRYYVASLYTKCPPLRQEEWLGAFIDVEDTGTNNFIDTNKKILYMRNYKTMKAHHDREIPLPNSLVRTIKIYKKKFNTDITVCKVTDNNKSMSTAGLSMYLKNIFGMSVCMLRKIYISNMLDNPNITVEQRKKTALTMGQTISTQEFLYSRFAKRNT